MTGLSVYETVVAKQPNVYLSHHAYVFHGFRAAVMARASFWLDDMNLKFCELKHPYGVTASLTT